MAIITSRTNENGQINFIYDRCNSCGLCVKICKDFSLKMEGNKPMLSEGAVFGCMACGHCMAICPEKAIEISGREMSADDLIDLSTFSDRLNYSQLRNLLISRRSIRDFKDKEIEEDVIEKIIEAAVMAPMGLPPSDVQLIVFKGKDKVQELDFSGGDDYLVIDNNIKNVIYKLSPCCNPIFGDDIFGFVTISEGIKIHRSSCPNAPQMIERYPYRVIKAKWQDTKKKSSFQATIRIAGTDEVGIVGQISHVISKDIGVQMRSINIENNNGDFDGTLRVYVNGLDHLDFLMNKLRSINGVFSVSRAD